jgi:hypothetical protein
MNIIGHSGIDDSVAEGRCYLLESLTFCFTRSVSRSDNRKLPGPAYGK